MYSDTQKQEIQKVIFAFKDYIQSSKYIDLLQSDKFGYILFYFNPPSKTMPMEPVIIADGSELCKLLVSEICSDVLELTRNEHSVADTDPLEKSEIIKRLEPFAKQLPEYRHLFEEIFTNANG